MTKNLFHDVLVLLLSKLQQYIKFTKQLKFVFKVVFKRLKCFKLVDL